MEQATSAIKATNQAWPCGRSDKDKLRDLARDALAVADGDFDSALETFLGALRRNVAMLRVLCEPYLREVSAETKRNGGGQQAYDTHRAHAAVVPPYRAAGAGHVRHDTHREDARPAARPQSEQSGQSSYDAQRVDAALSRPPLPAPPVSPPRAPRGAAAGALVQGTVALGLLASFMVNGRPIGKVTAGEARSWARTQQRHGHFAALLASGVPDTMLIGSCKTSADADKAWKIAEGETYAS